MDKVTESAKLLWRAADLIREAAEGLESTGASADTERAWLARYDALVELGKAERGMGGRKG